MACTYHACNCSICVVKSHPAEALCQPCSTVTNRVPTFYHCELNSDTAGCCMQLSGMQLFNALNICV
jgi:hypothetical protein